MKCFSVAVDLRDVPQIHELLLSFEFVRTEARNDNYMVP